MEINNNDKIKYLILSIFFFKITNLIEINTTQIFLVILILTLIYYYILDKNKENKKYKLLSKKYNINFNNNEILIKYLYDYNNKCNKKIFDELLNTIKMYLIYLNKNDIENSYLLMKECMNIHHSLFINDNKSFNNIIYSYLAKIENKRRELDSFDLKYNNNYDYY